MRETTMLATPPIGAFKAIVWKELRENLKWAVAGLLAMAAGLTYALQALTGEFRDWHSSTLAMSIFSVTTFGCALFGLFIGLAQTIPENRGDKWGFLAHRPIRRSTLFWGKAGSGILLYILATGLPFAGALVWMALPGHLPLPFEWRIALPGVADFLCGLVYYFAGLLTGMRDARWYASRFLGIGAAFACSVFATIFPAFWQAVATCIAGMLVVGTAAWGTFAVGGRYSVQPRRSRVAVGITVAAGITVAGFMAMGFVMNSLSGPSEFQGTTTRLTTDGVLVQTVEDNHHIVEVNDLEGRPLERYKGLVTRFDTLSMDVLSAELWLLSDRPSFRYRSTDVLFHKLEFEDSRDGNGPVSWYYVHRLGLIAGYSHRTSRLIGWIGPGGFSAGDTMPPRFETPLKNYRQGLGPPEQEPLLFEDAVYRFDPGQRRIERIFVPLPGESLLAANSPYNSASALATYGEQARFVVIATTQRVIVQLTDGTRLLETPHDPQASGYVHLRVLRPLRAIGMPTFLWYDYPSGRTRQERERPELVTEFNANGTIANHYSLPPYSSGSVQIITQPLVLTAATPLALQAVDEILHISGRDYSLFPRSLARGLPLLASLLFGVATFRRAGTYAFATRRRWFWTVLTFLLGPLAYLTMLALIEWPALERCPACGKKRIVTLERCEHCREPFAPPPLDGTEIFETRL